MPIYEYKCEHGHVFDTMQRMSDDPLTNCIECGAPVRKLMQPVGISFKGSGFYSTDYSSGKASTPPGSSESSSNGDSTNSSNGSSSNGSSSDKPSKETSKSTGGSGDSKSD